MAPTMYWCDSCDEGVSLTPVTRRPDGRSTIEYRCSCRTTRLRAGELERDGSIPRAERPHNWEAVDVFQPSAATSS